MSPAARGIRDEDHVVIEDATMANRLHQKTGSGEPLPGGALRLSLVEAADAVARGRLDCGQSVAELIGSPGTEAKYLVFRDLRARGLGIRHAAAGFDVWQRGQGVQGEPWFALAVHNERDPVQTASLTAGVIAVVDEDSVVTYYHTEAIDPQGSVPIGSLPSMTGHLLDDRVFVADAPAELRDESLGTAHDDDAILSLIEAASLQRRGVLECLGIEDQAAQQHAFPAILATFERLRSKGVVVKSGFRFGTHLRGYEGHPDESHAAWLIHCAAPDDVLGWSEISRGVRLAHGVRKQFLLANAGDDVSFLGFAWFRP